LLHAVLFITLGSMAVKSVIYVLSPLVPFHSDHSFICEPFFELRLRINPFGMLELRRDDLQLFIIHYSFFVSVLYCYIWAIFNLKSTPK
jgi:hypothetical protein